MGKYLDKKGVEQLWDKTKELVEDSLLDGPDTNGYDFVDMGEAGIWATCNIGASKPEELGLFFAWGEVEGWTAEQVNTKEKLFSWDTYKYCNGSDRTISKYCNSSSYGIVDNKLELEDEDDAAVVLMGGDWRMPNVDEFLKLCDLCSKSWITDYNGTGINGTMFTLISSPDKKVFFPASGFATTSVSIEGQYGIYWSRSLFESQANYAFRLSTLNGNYYPREYTGRCAGLTIRGFIPVDTKSSKYLTKEKAKSTYQLKITPGTGLAFASDGKTLNCTLNTTVFKVVPSLPSQPSNGDEQKIHLVKENSDNGNLFNEYLYVDGNWELIGSQKFEIEPGKYVTSDKIKLNYDGFASAPDDVPSVIYLDDFIKDTKQLATPDKNGTMSSTDKGKLDSLLKEWFGTQDEYNKLGTYSDDTKYYILEEE